MARPLKATLEYDGGRYRGWQAQMNARTVQGTLLATLRTLAGEDVRIHGAGRTDAGVHALGQVASLYGRALPSADLGSFRRRWNDLLPADINILDLVPAAPKFHARHDASLRIYRYRISRRRTAFAKRYVWWVKEHLNEMAMARAAALLPGRHDFRSFCENPAGHDSTLVEVAFADLEVPPEAPDLLLFRIAASHFLWKMVRRLAGTLVEVGAGRLSPEDVADFLGRRSDRPASLTAPASGLFLEAVVYPGDVAPPSPDPFRPGF